MSGAKPTLFALGATREYGQQVAAELGSELAAHEERAFEDGEHKSRPLEGVRGRDVYVLHSLYQDASEGVNDKLVRLLFFLGTLRDAHAGCLTAVIPYLAYARKDRRTKPRDPVTTRYVAQLLEAVGVDRVLAVDVHNIAAFENAFRVPVVHLEAGALFVRAFCRQVGNSEVVVVSPDAGGYKRAERLRELLAKRRGRLPGIAFMEKKRSDDVVSGEALVGEVSGRIAVIVDDLISTGGTLVKAAMACRKAGARAVYAAATHGLFTGAASRLLAQAPLERLFVADTVPPFRLDAEVLQNRVTVVPTAPLLGEAIRRLHRNGSLSELPTVFLDQG